MVINDELKTKVADLARKHGLSLVVLFGSQATGHTHKMSDIDIGYASEKDIDYAESYDITLKLCAIFNNKDVEFININNISPAHKKEISDTGITLFEKDSTVYDLYRINAFREYVDTAPLRKYKDIYINNFIEKYA